MRKRALLAFAAGWLALGFYTVSIYPPGAGRGYVEDFCMLDLTRQMTSEQVSETGRPRFESGQFMYPHGSLEVYMPWTLEISGLGAIFWHWNRDFPFYWAFFALTLLTSYLAVGFFSMKLGIPGAQAWALAALVAGANVPRHYNAWYHTEFLFLHWSYLSLFLDAWIWKRFEGQRRWSWSLEAWRAWMGLMTFGTAGYFWGALLLEWVIVRAWMFARWKRGARIRVEGSRRSAMAAGAASAAWIGVLLWWFLPFAAQFLKLGFVGHQIGWFGTFGQALRPLWLDEAWRWMAPALGMPDGLRPYSDVETVVTAGWMFWVPAIAVVAAQRRRGTSGKTAPFVALGLLALCYACLQPPALQKAIQAVVPFMNLFRTASRWGVLLPPILGVIIALGWDDLKGLCARAWRAKPAAFALGLAAFAVSSAFEIAELRAPVSRMAPLSGEMRAILDGLHKAPGKAVLDLPFCVAGANGACTNRQCPQYPGSTAGLCWRAWHDKAVFGAYQSRMVPEQCEIYNRPPYDAWFNAWDLNRCFSPREWDQFCGYLADRSDLSGILVYPDVWEAAGRPECWAEFERRLGTPIRKAEFEVDWTRGERAPRMSRVAWFPAKCGASRN